MAGAGYKLFTTGQVLTAAEVNTYLQEQTVMVFNDAASRTTALSGVLAEGMVSYLKSTKVVEIYNGTAWASLDDPNAIQNTIVDAKGDLIAATGNDVPARLAVGNNGETLVADSSTSTGLRWQGSQAAGRNLVVNGAFDYWQRGTSFAQTGVTTGYTADRWFAYTEGTSNATYSQQTSSLPAGFRYSMRCQRNSGNTGTGGIGISQALETSTSIPMQGQTIVLSYWAKAGANFSASSNTLQVRINSGTGTDQGALSQFGGWTGYAETAPNQALTTTWTRYQATYSVPAGATQLGLRFLFVPSGTAGANDWFEITGIQLEAGSVATPFTRAGGTLAGELAACQRYYYRMVPNGVNTTWFSGGFVYSTTNFIATFKLPVRMRVNPTSLETSGTASDYRILAGVTVATATGVPVLDTANFDNTVLSIPSSGLTVGQGGIVGANSTANAYLGFVAEL